MKRFEGLRRRSAALEHGGWTIGYGHTLSAREGAEVTEAEAEALLIYDLRRVAETVAASVYTPLSQNQFDALCAFAFNIGAENFARSAVCKRLNEGNYLQAATAFELWRKADFGGEELVVDALVRRRVAEKALFLTPSGGFRPVPTPVVRVKLDPSILESLEARRPNLASPVLGEGLLDGALATFEREEGEPSSPMSEAETHAEAPDGEEGSVALAAAANLRNRLERLLSDDEEPEMVSPPPPPAPEPELESEATTEAEEPQAEAEPVAEPEPPPAPEPEAAPLADPLNELLQGGEPSPAPESLAVNGQPGAFGRRTQPLEYSAYPAATPTPRRNRAPFGAPMLILALVGAAMFVGSIVAMLGGKATFPNLCIGLVGIICLAPAGIRFLLNRAEQRPGASPTE